MWNSLGTLAKLRTATISSCLSVCPHVTTQLPQNGFSLNLIIEHFSKNSVEFCQEWRGPYMKTYIQLWQYLAQFFLQWWMFQTSSVEKIKTHISCSVTFSRKSCRLWDNVEKYCTSWQATDNIIRRMRFVCWILKAIDTHSEYVILIAFPP